MMPPMLRENNKVKCVFWGKKDGIFALELLCIKGGTRRMFIRLGIAETEQYSKKRFVAPNPISCGRFLSLKSVGYLLYCRIGLNQDSCKYTDSNHNPGELSSPMSNARKQRDSFFTSCNLK
jgi:hypothetical protein